MTERLVWMSPSGQLEQLALYAQDVTDPTVHATAPYRLVRRNKFMPEHLVAELNRRQLDDLYRAIARELAP